MPISVVNARAGRIVQASTVARVVWTTLDGVEHYQPADRSVREAVPRGLAMRRKGHQRQHAPRHRDHYCDASRRHVWCESGAEELAMLVADRDPEVMEYRAQAIEFVWPLSCVRTSHVIDRIDYLRGGGIRLVDVHRLDDNDFREQAEMTAAACERIGWQYTVFDGLPGAMAHNVAFLAPDRHQWVIDGREDMLSDLLAHSGAPVVISDLCQRVRPNSPHVVLPIIYYALWHKLIDANLSEPLHATGTRVWRTDPVTPEAS